MTGCQRGDLISADLEVRIGADEKGVGSLLGECCEGRIDVMFATSIQDIEQQPERARGRTHVSCVGFSIRIGRVYEKTD